MTRQLPAAYRFDAFYDSATGRHQVNVTVV